MGVSGLWDILSEGKALKNITDIKGETVAIDLATWICEAEGVGLMKTTVKNPYLRNLLFRVVKFSSNGVKLVFVADGTPPELKHNTIARRLNARHTSSGSFKKVSRTRLNSKLKECCDLLDALGISWLKSAGEAEATCAALNAFGRIDACATTDGDVFLYGANTVYRNLTAEKDAEFECYEMRVIEERLGLTRDHLISLGLILGCDYCDGVTGIGKVQALKWLRSLNKGENPLEKMKQWKICDIESHLHPSTKPTHCSVCKHVGSKKEHNRDKCLVCGQQCKREATNSIPCNCMWHMGETKRRETEIEDKIIKRAKEDPDFPKESVIAEFQKRLDPSTLRFTEPKMPSLSRAVEMVTDKLEWSEKYSVQKILPMLTRWLLTNKNNDKEEVVPRRICRTRIKDKVPVYEMEWRIKSIPDLDDQVTCEPRDLVNLKFPDIVASFNERIEREKAEKKALKKKSKNATGGDNVKITDHFKKKKPVKREKVREETTEVDCVTSSFSHLALTPILISSDDDDCSSNYVLQEQMENTDSFKTNLRTSLEQIDLKESFSSSKLSLRDSYDASSDLFDLPISFSDSRLSLEKENIPVNNDMNKETGLDGPGSPVFMSLTDRIRFKDALL